jgi:hypothetical protein
MLAQQLCGINIMAFYRCDTLGSMGNGAADETSSTIFVEGGYTAVQALYASIGE